MRTGSRGFRIGIRVALACALAVSGLGQAETEVYFGLSSTRSFGSDGKPSVLLNAWNVDSVEFRVYRINDTIRFFQNLDQPHEFGEKAPKPPKERTALEQIHEWKRSLKVTIRRSLRGQFSESPSAHVNSLLPRKAAPAPVPATPVVATLYAESPVLNPQQLVMTFNQPVNKPSRWDREEVNIPVTDKGVYLVEAVNHDLRAYTVLFVSDVAMVSKAGKGHILNYVVDRKSGQPLAGVPLSAVGAGQVLATGQTDKDGILDLKVKADSHRSEITVVALKGRDVAANSLGLFEGNDWVGYVYTDRPIYRPGHTVHFKAIVRLRTGDSHEIPAGQNVTVEIDDPDQKPVYQKSLTVSANGTIHDEVELTATAPLGSYFIQVKRQPATSDYGDTATGSFDVQAYRKPEYEVRVTPAKARVLQGETGHATIEARYFFGEPVSGAKVTYSIYKSRYWFPVWYDPEDQDGIDGDPGDRYFSGDQATEQTGQLDANGKLEVEIPTDPEQHGYDVTYRVEAHVTDAGNREIAGAGRMLASYGNFVLNVTPDRYVYAPGGQASVKVEAMDYDRQPVRTKVHIEVLPWSRTGGEAAVITKDLETGAGGDVRVQFPVPEQGGSYRVRATAKSGDREVTEYTWLWISGKGDMWGGSRSNSLDIIPDKKTYKPGETAKLLIVTGQADSTVLVTLETNDVRQFKVVRSKGPTVEFEFPVEARFEPGLNVTVSGIRDGQAYSGTKYIRIPPVDHQLNVKLATDKAQYLPGESADYSLEVTDTAGKPAAKAEFSLGVVDEAIYGIQPDVTPNILSFFFGRRYYYLQSANSLNFYFHGQAGKKRMQLTDLRDRSHLAQLKPERLVEPKVRKAFPDTAFWAADLVTDGQGRAHTKVNFPDSLTTWRATARGIGPGTTVGSTTLKTIVRKNLIVRLVTPRFLVSGDEVTVSALVHNYLATAKRARVSLDVKGLTVLSGTTQEVMIPSKGEAKADWRLKPASAGTAVLTGKALTDEESDALEIELPVQAPGITLSKAQGGSIAAGGSAEFDVAFPQAAIAGTRTLSVSVAPSIAGSLFSALEYLTSFPYGCVEQTMSGFLPDIIVKEAVQSLGLKANLNQASLAEKIQAGLDRLYGYQHQDGGWGWWETDASHPFMTAYVVAGLTQAKGAGTSVREEVIRKGVAWLRKDLADSKRAGDLRAYQLYALTVAGQADAEKLTALYDGRSELSPYGLGLLGLALETAKDDRAVEIAGILETGVQQDGKYAWWTAKRDPLLDFDADATPEATALILRFLSHEKKESPLLSKAALWLVDHRNEGYWWSTTKQTAMVIYSLIDYLKATRELSPNVAVTVSVNGKVVLTTRFDQLSPVSAPNFVLTEENLQPGGNYIKVSTTGSGRVYYGARQEYNTLEMPAANPAMTLTREYFRMVAVKSGDKIVYDTTPLEGPVAPGDTLAVRLGVTGSAKYMIVEDPIPAGTEFIPKDNLFEVRNAPRWWQWYYDRREMHDDHMAIFQTYSPGSRDYFYLLKVVNPGVFQIKPAKAGPMYQTDVAALAPGRTLEVK